MNQEPQVVSRIVPDHYDPNLSYMVVKIEGRFTVVGGDRSTRFVSAINSYATLERALEAMDYFSTHNERA